MSISFSGGTSARLARAGALLLALAAGGGSDAEPARVVVEIRAYAFVAADVTIAPGTTVEWINRDETPHNIVSTSRAFASKGLDTGDRFELAFEREGDYPYVCALHPFMTGTIHVRRSGT